MINTKYEDHSIRRTCTFKVVTCLLAAHSVWIHEMALYSLTCLDSEIGVVKSTIRNMCFYNNCCVVMFIFYAGAHARMHVHWIRDLKTREKKSAFRQPLSRRNYFSLIFTSLHIYSCMFNFCFYFEHQYRLSNICFFLWENFNSITH